MGNGDSPQIYGPSATARKQTDRVAHCKVCGVQWQVRSESGEDARTCAFCGAPKSAITIESEAPSYGGAIIRA